MITAFYITTLSLLLAICIIAFKYMYNLYQEEKKIIDRNKRLKKRSLYLSSLQMYSNKYSDVLQVAERMHDYNTDSSKRSMNKDLPDMEVEYYL